MIITCATFGLSVSFGPQHTASCLPDASLLPGPHHRLLLAASTLHNNRRKHTDSRGVARVWRGGVALGCVRRPPGSPPLRRCTLARLVSWRIRRSEMATRNRARTAMLVDRDNMAARGVFQFHHAAIALAAAAAVQKE